MIDLTRLIDALHDVLVNYAPLLDLVPSQNIEKSEVVNASESIANNGWIGIFEGDQSIAPKTIGPTASSYEYAIDLIIMIQYADFIGGFETTKHLNEITKNVLDAINSNRKLNNEWDMFTGARITPRINADDETSLVFQSRNVIISGVKRP